jgi:hypothetical protein
MGWIGTGIALAGVALAATSEIRGGYAASQAAEYNEAMARYEADYQTKKAGLEEEQHRRDVRKFIGEQTVRGAAGGGVGSGSDLSPLLDTLAQGEIDAALIRYGGAVESWRSKAAADLFSAEAKEHKTAGYLGHLQPIKIQMVATYRVGFRVKIQMVAKEIIFNAYHS